MKKLLLALALAPSLAWAAPFPNCSAPVTGATSATVTVFGCPPIAVDLVSAWPLTSVADAFGANTLTNNNAVTFVPLGPSGVVADFEQSSSESLSKTSTTNLQTGGRDFSFAFWVKPESIIANDGVIVKDDTGANREFVILFSNAATLTFFILGTGAASVNAAAPYTDLLFTGHDSFVVAWLDRAADTINIQVNNGAIATTSTIVEGADTASDFQVGAFTGSNFYDGRLGRLGRWNVALSASERTSLYNAGKGKSYAALTTAEKVGLVSYWNLDEASGNRADSHGSNTLTDNNTVGSTTNSYPDNMPGTVANFVAASSQWFNVADNASTTWGETGDGVSLSFWVRVSGSPVSYALFFGRNNSGAERNFEHYSNAASYATTFMAVIAGGTVQTTIASPGLTDGVWRHVVVTFDPADKKQRYYVDGALVETGLGAGSATVAGSTADVAIGGWPTIGGYLNGDLSGIYIADRLWTAPEIACLWNGGAGAFYPFENVCTP